MALCSLVAAAAADRSLIYTVMAPNRNLFLLLSVRNSREREREELWTIYSLFPIRRGAALPLIGAAQRAHTHTRAATTPRNGGPLQRQRPQFVFVSAGPTTDRPGLCRTRDASFSISATDGSPSQLPATTTSSDIFPRWKLAAVVLRAAPFLVRRADGHHFIPIAVRLFPPSTLTLFPPSDFGMDRERRR